MLNIATKELNLHKCKPNCFEKTAVRWDFFYFIAPNLDIESITIHPQLRGIETIKLKKRRDGNK